MLALAIALTATAGPASAGFLDFLFNPQDQSAAQKATPAAASQANPFASPTEDGTSRAPLPPIGGGYARSTGHCVRMCDGMHFPVHGRGEMSPTAMCQAFCPASVT